MDANKVMRSVGFILGVAEGLLAVKKDTELTGQVYADLEAAYQSVKEEVLGPCDQETVPVHIGPCGETP